VKLENEFSSINKIGISAKLIDNLNLPFETVGGIEFENQANFNPLKFLKAITKDLKIYENTHIDKLKGNYAYTSNGYTIHAKKIVFATHFPFMDKHGFYFLKMYQEKSYALAIESKSDIDNMYIDDKSELSIRRYGNYLILGGQKHRTGKQNDGFKKLEEIANKYFPENNIKYRWTTQDCITLDGVPYIGKYWDANDNFYVITGFNKWGMTSSMIGSEIIADMIEGKENKYEKIFSPKRSILRKQLFVNIAESTIGIINPLGKRCTHLGCKLKWNKNEKVWECPCHGSKFDANGEVLNGPANKNL
jgi:glycine/D-amino acid oxidase-like deaminating enzyme